MGNHLDTALMTLIVVLLVVLIGVVLRMSITKSTGDSNEQLGYPLGRGAEQELAEQPAQPQILVPFTDAGTSYQVRVGDSDAAVIQVRACPEDFDPSVSGTRLKRKDIGIERLSPFLQALPATWTAGVASTGSYMEVIVDGALAASSDPGLFRPVVIDGAGRIVKHAQLRDADFLVNAATGAALFNLVSAVVAQKHLADINKHLKTLSREVSRITDMLRSQRKHKVLSVMTLMRQRLGSMSEGELDPSWASQLDNYERDLVAVLGELSDEIESSCSELREISGKFWPADYSRIASEIEDLQDSIADSLRLAFLTNKVRLGAWVMRRAFPGAPSTMQRRLEDIAGGFELLAGKEVIKEIRGSVHEAVAEIRTFVGIGGSAVISCKEERNEQLKNLLSEIKDERSTFEASIKKTEEIRVSHGGKRRLAFMYDGRKVSHVHELGMAS